MIEENLDKMPSHAVLSSLRYSGLAGGMQKHGGFPHHRKLLAEYLTKPSQ